MKKEEAIAKLHAQGYEVNAKESKELDAILSSGELSEVSGGLNLDPRFKKALIGAGILVAGVGVASGGYYLKHRKSAKQFGPQTVETTVSELGELKEENILPEGSKRRSSVDFVHGVTFVEKPIPPAEEK